LELYFLILHKYIIMYCKLCHISSTIFIK